MKVTIEELIEEIEPLTALGNQRDLDVRMYKNLLTMLTILLVKLNKIEEQLRKRK